MTRRNDWLKKVIVILIVAYISPSIAAMIVGLYTMKYVYELGKNLKD